MKTSTAKSHHFIVAIDEKRQLFSYVCELQPMATIRSHGHPTRCPCCRHDNPFTRDLLANKIGRRHDG